MKLAQITDCHLHQLPTTWHKGINSDERLSRCLAWIALGGYDGVLLTGDISQDGSFLSYERVVEQMAGLNLPWWWLPGNHDDTHVMQVAHGQAVDSVRVVALGDWQMLLLNSTHHPDGKGNGSISAAHMTALVDALDMVEKPTLVAVHHNPIEVNSAWQDEIMLGNAEGFRALLAQYTHVKAVVFGHIHQPLDRFLGATRFLGTPATTVQFRCQQAKFVTQPALGPGIRTLHLREHGILDTRVHYLGQR